MGTSAIFPRARARAGMYESFYLRAVDPAEPRGLWIRHTVHKRPGARATGAVWCTFFDARADRPFMHKVSGQPPVASPECWIAIGEHARIGPGWAQGSCGPASWAVRYESDERELRHLSPELLYRAPLPRTKLTSPAPAALFEGTFALDGSPPIEMHGWPGMVGHNWGSEHAERWIWLHGICFDDAPEAWLDVALGRVRVAGRMTPWVANGALSLGGVRQRIGGFKAREVRVSETVDGCSLRVSGEHELTLAATVQSPPVARAGWRYRDPDGGEHDVVNCSIASLELELEQPGTPKRILRARHGGAYELGMRERDHGVALAPFDDG